MVHCCDIYYLYPRDIINKIGDDGFCHEACLMLCCVSSVSSFCTTKFYGAAGQWLVCRTCDLAVVGSIPTTAHVVIALRKKFTYITSVHQSVKHVPGYRELKCIDY